MQYIPNSYQIYLQGISIELHHSKIEQQLTNKLDRSKEKIGLDI